MYQGGSNSLRYMVIQFIFWKARKTMDRKRLLLLTALALVIAFVAANPERYAA
jgi:hypothetical protein